MDLNSTNVNSTNANATTDATQAAAAGTKALAQSGGDDYFGI